MDADELRFTSHAPPVLQAGTRLRVGTVVECVGGGTTGHVYRVLDDLGSPIAVREYFPGALAMRVGDAVQPQPQRDAGFEAGRKLFNDDGAQMAALDHPGLLKVQQVWSERGTSYQSMPWCEGRTLGEVLLAARVPPSQGQLSDWMRAIADALAPVHHQIGLHGHLSPSQIMRLDSGRLLVMEFSRTRRFLARDPRDIERDPFAALECGSDGRYGPMGPWTDIYALAAIAHFAVRRRPPQTPVRRVDDDAQEPLLQDIDGDYDDAFLHGIDCGLALRPRSRPRDLPAFMARAGLHERRMRPRPSGESLRVKLHLADAAGGAEDRAGPIVFDEEDIVLASVPASAFGPEVGLSAVEGETVEPPAASDAVPHQGTPWPAATAPDTATAAATGPTATPMPRRARSTPIRTVPKAAPRRSRAASQARSTLAVLAGLGAVSALVAFAVMLFDEPDVAALSWKPALPALSARPEGTAPADAPPVPAEAVPAAQAAATASSSPIPDPLEPTAAGPATASSADPAASAARTDEAAPAEALPQAQDGAAERPASGLPGPSARPDRAGSTKPAAPAATAAAQGTADASGEASPCPGWLARQYIGRPLDAAEREQMNTICR